jgi:glyoxylase-like metal-dependent hydrolase (beta-lactamase superfamily II)
MSQTDQIEYVASLTRPPLIPDDPPVEIAPGVYLLRDRHIPLVPNVGVVTGPDAGLVIDTGVGLRNGRRLLARSRELTDRDLILTITHFHPEHRSRSAPGAAAPPRRSASRATRQRPARHPWHRLGRRAAPESGAIAVFLDAVVIRLLLLPAVLELLGRRTWALPNWLEGRLPHIAIEAERGQQAEPALQVGS